MTGVGTQIKNALSWFKTKCDSYYVRKTTDIINNCSSTDTTKPLSAAQGKELQSQIDSLKSSSGSGGGLFTRTVSYSLKIPADTIKHYEYSVGNNSTILGVVGFDAATSDSHGTTPDSSLNKLLVNQAVAYDSYVKFSLYNTTNAEIRIKFFITLLCQSS